MRREYRVTAMIGVIILMVAAGACTPSTQESPEASAVPATEAMEPTEAEAPPEAEASPEAVGPTAEITYVVAQTTATLDPAIHRDYTTSAIVYNVYDPLVIPVEGGEIVPNLATGWDVSPDGLVWTFHLREGVRFHDGQELTAEDVVFSIDRILTLNKGYAFLWAGVIEPGTTVAVDDYTVEFHLTRPFAPLPSTLIQLFIVNQQLVMENLSPGEYDEFQDYGQEFLSVNNAGSGPYVIGQYEPGNVVVFDWYKDYFGGWEEDQIARVNMRYVSEFATQKLMLQQGDANISDQYLAPEVYEELKGEPGLRVYEEPSAQLWWVALNTQRKPLDDLHFRKAVSYAFPYDIVNETILNGARQAHGPVPFTIDGHTEDVTVYEYDLDKAREELALSEYAGESFTLTISGASEVQVWERVALAYREELGKLGIDLEIELVPFARVQELISTAETAPDMALIILTAQYPSPNVHTYGMYHPSAWGNYGGASFYDNPRGRHTVRGRSKRTVLRGISREIRSSPDPNHRGRA